MLCLLIVFFAVFRQIVHAKESSDSAPKQVDYLAEYEAISYSTYDGLISNEINAIAQTLDGYIWVGTYSGLYRYDGVKFESAEVEDLIKNVMELFVDSRGRLWIGTNDSGLMCYYPEDGSVSCYTTEEGLSANAIRSVNEDDNGNIYVGTVDDLNVITPDDSVKTLKFEEEGINSVRSLANIGKGVVAGVTNGGILFFVKDGELIYTRKFGIKGVTYTCVSTGEDGRIFTGTSGNLIEKARFDGQNFYMTGTISTDNVNYVNYIMDEKDGAGFFFCAENGLGYVNTTGKVTFMMKSGFESSISDCISDYQGNIWFVSNKQGIKEFSRNPFFNVFVKAGLDSSVVNSVHVLNDEIYIAMDSGLAILDAGTYAKKDFDYLHYFDGIRIRHITNDKEGNLWLSTYGRDGLVKVKPDGSVVLFNENSKDTLGGRFRYSMEQADGTIIAASNLGLNFIEGDEVVATLGEQQGMSTPQILTIVEDKDGTVYAGSDGDGIYLIKDREVVGHIGMEEGLETLVVLRIVPCHDGFIYVTSNALYYDNRQTIERLTAFPYSNCYDVYISENGTAWVSSSAGIFIVSVDDLIGNGEYSYDILDYSRGFNTTLTANSWNTLLGDDGDLLLCCTDGVRQISTKSYNAFDNDFYVGVSGVTADETEIKPDENGVYTIPAGTGRIQIQAAILNFMLSNPIIKLYLEGAKDEGTTVYQGDLTALSYTNLPYGSYKLHIQVLDRKSREILRDEIFDFYKEPEFSELLIVRIGFALLLAATAGFLVWWFMRSTIIRRQYEQIRLAKEEADRANSAKSRFLANMSHEIRTPINTIIGMDEMILREDRSAGTAKYANAVSGYAISIKRASETLLSLVNDILDLSKIESGKMNLVERSYDLTELLRTIATMIRVRSNEKDLMFDIDIDPNIPTKLYGDDGKIKQVLMNLLTNAVKYTPKGSFKLSLKLVDRQDDTCTIHYSVSDTGMGIKPEDMDKLFSAFERLDEKKNSGIQGTGLGLNISRQFVELMGDELGCESTYGEGSTFFFTLKQKVEGEELIGEFTEKDSGALEDERYIPLFTAPDARILVVDDNEMNLQVIKGLLKGTKLQIETALSGKECLKLLKENHFELVLLDHMMPEMDGVETLGHIREDGHTLPVFALTANAANSGENYYVKRGFTGYLEKPVDGRKLEETLKQYIPDELLKEPDPDEYSGLPDDGEDTGADAAGDLAWLFETEGIDVPLGIKNCGSKDAFLTALGTFHMTLEEKADEIEDAYKKKDWDFYTIKVHALKSSARIIGAARLSELAAGLEAAGKSGDTDTIMEQTGELLELYRGYEKKLEKLSEDKPEDGDRERIDDDTLSEAYEALREFAQLMDYDSAEMVLDEMKEFSMAEDDRKKFEQINKLLKELKWEELRELLGEG